MKQNKAKLPRGPLGLKVLWKITTVVGHRETVLSILNIKLVIDFKKERVFSPKVKNHIVSSSTILSARMPWNRH